MTSVMTQNPAASPELAAVETRQQAMWASGDFAVIGTTIQIVGEMICEAVDVFRVVASHVPPVPGVQSPLLWGTDAHIGKLFEDANAMAKTARFYAFRYRSPKHWLDVFRTYYGPVHKAFAALDAGLVIPAEYLETVITK